MKYQLPTLFLLSFVILTSCSKGSGEARSIPTPSVDLLEVEMHGTYQAILAPVNKTLSGHLNGNITMIRERDDLIIETRLSGGPKSVLHNQSIHIGERCPTPADDINGDGYVDAEEGINVYREIMIPMDDDISSQRMGGGIYPVSDEFGYYLWSRTTAFERLMEDLYEEDINPKDDYAKLPMNKNLTVLGKVAVIMGVPDTSTLPATVAGRGRLSPHQALPIACGVLRRIGKAPGRIDADSTGIPVPSGETIGGSSGADDGATFPAPDEDTGDYGDENEPEIITNETEHGTGGTRN